MSELFIKSMEFERDFNRLESAGWDRQFQNYWGHIVKSQKDFKRNETLSERFIDHVGKFREAATEVVVSIV